mgnify:CR=1 FL=1
MGADRQTPIRLDETDRKILSLLQEDATLSLDDIAARVGASKTPVWNRIRKLREAMLSQAEGKDDDPTGTAMALARIGRDIATMARGSMDLKRFQAAIEEAARKRLIEAQRAKLDELGKTGAVAPDVLAKVIKAAYDL